MAWQVWRQDDNGNRFLTDYIREEVDFRSTAQSRGIRPPPVQKPVTPGSTVIPLPDPENCAVPPCDLQSAIANRQSHRRFTAESFVAG